MVRASISKRLAILGCGLLLAASGCGDNTAYEGVEQQSTEAQQKARAAAYANANNPGGRGRAGKPPLSAEAQARQRAGR